MAFETIHHTKRNTSTSNGLGALDVDMRKAYDRVELLYLQKNLEILGIDSLWVSWSTKCVSSVKFWSLMLFANGSIFFRRSSIEGCLVIKDI